MTDRPSVVRLSLRREGVPFWPTKPSASHSQHFDNATNSPLCMRTDWPLWSTSLLLLERHSADQVLFGHGHPRLGMDTLGCRSTLTRSYLPCFHHLGRLKSGAPVAHKRSMDIAPPEFKVQKRRRQIVLSR